MTEQTYIPAVHCAVCIQFGRHTAATRAIHSEGRYYQACDDHAPLVERGGFPAAIRQAKRTGGAV